VGDGIKVSKEGRKMPGVKRLHQESEDVSKPEWIRGHYFSALGLLLSADKAIFATLIALKVHDGIEGIEEDAPLTKRGENGIAMCQIYGKGKLCSIGCILCLCQSLSSISSSRHPLD
jgi:hypothetical protein